jgi:hypothetical protein
MLLIALPVVAAEPDSKELAGKVDRLLADRWAEAKVTPAEPASDAEFLRRAYLDLAGVVPSTHETREFLTDKSPDKRDKLIEKLLKSPRYTTHFTNFWRAALLPESPNGDVLGLRFSFEAWLRDRLQKNDGYDRIAREILTTALPRGRRGEIALDGGMMSQLSPIAFDQANEGKPENLAGSTARLFLAVKLECAQCHNHPHADWTQDQFWAYAAFFGGTRTSSGLSIKVPKSNKAVSAKFPNGKAPNLEKMTNPRTTLADWVTAPENPYFARATVNRLWAHFFGNGLVEPIDDLTQELDKNPVLDELARQFAAHNFDLKYLIRAIVSTRAYQATSAAKGESSSDDLRMFARMPVRALAPEQIYDSLLEVLRVDAAQPDANDPLGPSFFGRMEFQSRFQRQNEKATEAQTSILQALSLMNGKLVEDATTLERSSTLGAIAQAPYLSTTEKVEWLFLAALSRPPRTDEVERFGKYVTKGGPSGDPQRALADVFWVLLNSGEFLFNH